MDGSVEWVGLLALGGGGVTVGCVEVVKRLLRRYANVDGETEAAISPVLAIFIGIFWNWLLLTYLRAEDARLVTIVLFGLVSGLVASGLWSSTKNGVVEPIRQAQVKADILKYRRG